jgi:hypothetical protein
MRERQGAERTLDGEGVEGEAGRCVLRDGDVEVFGPANSLGIDPFVFVFWGVRNW